MRVFTRQQTTAIRHHKPVMSNKIPRLRAILLLFSFVLVFTGCIKIKTSDKRPVLLKTEIATQAELLNEVNRFAKVNSLRAKMDLNFEDNSYAELGIAEKYRRADGEIVVERPAKILLKVQVPLIKTDVVQMTSNGEKFRVAILEDGGSGKFKNFVLGTNKADYALLQAEVNKADFNGNSKEIKQNVNAFASMRPQHFTDAILVRPVDTTSYVYTQSSILQEEEDKTAEKKSPIRRVLRGYYLLDEFRKNDDGSLTISRRFWFDRVGSIRLARQQIFDAQMEIESDIVYGREGNLTDSGEYNNLPIMIAVTRPKEKYKMSLTYQTPESVEMGETYPAEAFILENRWNLPVIDLDKKLEEARSQKPQSSNQNSATRSQEK